MDHKKPHSTPLYFSLTYKVSIFFGIIFFGFLLFIHYSQGAKDHVGKLFKNNFESSFDCILNARVTRINWLLPTLVLEDVTVMPSDKTNQSWRWCAKSYTTHFSWWHLFAYGSIDMNVHLNGVRAESTLQDGVAIMQHIKQLTQGGSSSIPLFMKSLLFTHSSLNINGYGSTTTLMWNSESRKIGSIFKTLLYFTNGSHLVNDSPAFRRLSGPVQIDIPDTNFSANMLVHVDCSCDVPQLNSNDPTCFITGSWRYNHGLFNIHSTDRSLMINPIKIDRMGKNLWLSCNGSLPFTTIARTFMPSLPNTITGTCGLYVHGLLYDEHQGLHGHLTFDHPAVGMHKLAQMAKISFNKKESLYTGEIIFDNGDSLQTQGAWQWNAKDGKGALSLDNKNLVSLSRKTGWHVEPGKGSLQMNLDTTFLSGNYGWTATQDSHEEHINTNGLFSFDGSTIKSSGALYDYIYDFQAVIKPHVRLKKFVCHTKGKQTSLIELYADKKNKHIFSGDIDVDCARSLLLDAFGYDLQGSGKIRLRGLCNKDEITTDICLVNASIRLPQTYNFMSDLSAKICCNLHSKTITMQHMRCALHKGFITSEQMIFGLDNACNVPLKIDSCLLNFNKDLFAILSGDIVFIKHPTMPGIFKGNFILERSQLKENLFSASFQKNLFKYAGNALDTQGANIGLDVSIKTKNPVRVDTAFLKTNATIEKHVGGNMHNPKVSGNVKLMAGSLEFPYKNLYINKGSLYFLQDQPYDPIVELVAQNKIKKYTVTLQVTGSLKNHHIMLSSTPPLTEEQIIALLLVGSQEESLNIVMPALIMQNITSMIFESDQSPLKLGDRFSRFLKPFRRIHLVPSFSDQTGRGGLRGTLEIDVNERWRALIQKNFSLSEDTRFEIEYFLSDEITLRGIRDERRDIGGEVEMRWKF